MTRTVNPIERFRSAKLPEISVDDLQPRSDLTFKVFDGLAVDGTNVHQSLLNGCLFRDCTFRKVSFSRCDLEQVQFQSCSFTEVDFTNIELTSAQIALTRFEKCNFESALLSDCHWSDCVLENCSFQQALIHTSQFEQCRLAGNNLRGASLQLDTFRKCVFEDMKLGDCTFLNHVLAECSYKGVHINAESIGSLFGLSEHDLLSSKLIYLGQEVVNVAGAGGLLDSLEKDYEQRRWFLMCEMLRLNFGRTSHVIGLDACLRAVLWPASRGIPLKVNDIAFLEMVVLELFQCRQLPALTALTFPEHIKNLRQQGGPEKIERNDRLRLQQLGSRLQSIFLELLQQLAKETERLTKKDRAVKVTLCFEEKPSSDTVKFIRSMANTARFELCGPTKKLQEQSGSYLLFLQTTLMTLAAFQTALWLLNGCVAQVIELKSRFQIATQKNSPKVIRDRMLLPDQNIPKWMTVAVQSIFTKLTANPTQLQQIASDFGQANLKKIEISTSSSRKRSLVSKRKD